MTYGPRPELVAEFLAKAGVGLHIYNPERFIEYAQDYLKQTISKNALQEIEELATKPEWPQGLIKWFVPELKDTFLQQISGLLSSGKGFDIDFPIAGSLQPPGASWKFSQDDWLKLRSFLSAPETVTLNFDEAFRRAILQSLFKPKAVALEASPTEGTEPKQNPPASPNQEQKPPEDPQAPPKK